MTGARIREGGAVTLCRAAWQLAWLMHLAAMPAAAADLRLVGSGAGEAEIVTSPVAPEGVSEAAKELRRLVEASTGVRLPVVATPSPRRVHFVVGAHPLAAAAGIGAGGLPPDGYRLRVVDRSVFLLGRDDSVQPFFLFNNNQTASAGTYYAVLEFARRYLGARWYMPGPLGEEIRRQPDLAVPADLDVAGAPRFPLRYLDVVQTNGRARFEALVRQGDLTWPYYNGAAEEDAGRWGRHLRLGAGFQLNVEHAWHLWIPAEKPTTFVPRAYGRSHPEYFAVPGGRNGRYYYDSDDAHGGQLCTRNPDVAAEYARNVVTYARRTGERVFSLSPNDGDFKCAVACCGVADALGRNDRRIAGEVIAFANDVAARVRAQVPDARFGLYAYQATLDPPGGLRVDPAIDISDVYNGLPYLHARAAERAMVEYRVRRWRTLGQRVVLTTYYTFEGQYSMPWSTVDTLAWLVRLLAESPASAGLRMNLAPLDPAPVGVTGPDAWVLSELLWNPDQPLEPLVAEYFAGAFGPAGPYVRAYFDALGTSMVQAVATLPYREANGVPDYFLPAYSRVRAQCAGLIASAEEAVRGADVRYRWRVDRVARGWRLAELTLDLLAAGRAGAVEDVDRIAAARANLLRDPQSIFALASASTEFMEHRLPLAGGNRHP